MRHLLFVGIVLLFGSCADPAPERKQVADLMDALDHSKTVFESNGPETLPMKEDDIQSRLDKVSLSYSSRNEIFDMRVGLMLADFKVYKKVFKGLPEKRAKIKEEIELSYNQLKSMDHDLKHGLMPKSEIEANIAKERDAIMAITASVAQLDTLMARGKRGYIKKLPGIEALIDSLSTIPVVTE